MKTHLKWGAVLLTLFAFLVTGCPGPVDPSQPEEEKKDESNTSSTNFKTSEISFDSVTFTWDKLDVSSAIKYPYEVYIYQGDKVVNSNTIISTTTVTLDDLEPKTEYTAKLIYFSSDSVDKEGGSLKFTTKELPAPTLTLDGKTRTLKASINSYNTYTVKLHYSETKDGEYINAGSISEKASKVSGTFEEGKTYWFKAVYKNTSSEPISLTINYKAPNAVSDITLARGLASIEFSWNAVPKATKYIIREYKYESLDYKLVDTKEITETKFRTYNTRSYFTVTAANDDGEGPESQRQQGSTMTKDVVINYIEQNQQSVKVQCELKPSTSKDDTTKYYLDDVNNIKFAVKDRYAKDSDPYIVEPTEGTIELTNLEIGESEYYYFYYILTYTDSDGNNAKLTGSNYKKIATKGLVPPKNFTVKPSVTSAILSFDNLDDSEKFGKTQIKYQIEYYEKGAEDETVDAIKNKSKSAVITSGNKLTLDMGKNYRARIRSGYAPYRDAYEREYIYGDFSDYVDFKTYTVGTPAKPVLRETEKKDLLTTTLNATFEKVSGDFPESSAKYSLEYRVLKTSTPKSVQLDEAETSFSAIVNAGNTYTTRIKLQVEDYVCYSDEVEIKMEEVDDSKLYALRKNDGTIIDITAPGLFSESIKSEKTQAHVGKIDFINQGERNGSLDSVLQGISTGSVGYVFTMGIDEEARKSNITPRLIMFDYLSTSVYLGIGEANPFCIIDYIKVTDPTGTNPTDKNKIKKRVTDDNENATNLNAPSFNKDGEMYFATAETLGFPMEDDWIYNDKVYFFISQSTSLNANSGGSYLGFSYYY